MLFSLSTSVAAWAASLAMLCISTIHSVMAASFQVFLAISMRWSAEAHIFLSFSAILLSDNFSSTATLAARGSAQPQGWQYQGAAGLFRAVARLPCCNLAIQIVLPRAGVGRPEAARTNAAGSPMAATAPVAVGQSVYSCTTLWVAPV